MRCPKFTTYLIIALQAPLFLFGHRSVAQLPGLNAQTLTPIPGAGHDYAQVLNDTVDPASGALSVHITIPTPPGRGFTLPFSLNYSSNAPFAIVDSIAGPNFGPGWASAAGEGGFFNSWTDSLPSLSANYIDMYPYTYGTGSSEPYPCPAQYGYTFVDPNGGKHVFPNLENVEYTSSGSTPLCPGPVYPFTPKDTADQYQAMLSNNQPNVSGPFSVYVIDRNGTTFYFPEFPNGGTVVSMWPTSIEDRNGNLITVNGTCEVWPCNDIQNVSLTDTIGRSVSMTSSASQTTLTVPGQPQPYTINWATANGTGFTRNYNVIYQYNPLGGNGCSFLGQTTAAAGNEISTLALPDGTNFTFRYDNVYGLLNQITYPNGAVVDYTWGLNPLSASENATWQVSTPDITGNGVCNAQYDTPAVTKRKLTINGQLVKEEDFNYYQTTWDPTTKYNWTAKRTDATTIDYVRNASFVTQYYYSPSLLPSVAYEPSYQNNQVPVEQKIVYSDWNGSLLRTVNKTWLDPYMMASEAVTLPNGGPTEETAYSYGPLDAVTEEDIYDFGQSAPTKIASTNYQSFANAATNIPNGGAPGGLNFIAPSQVITCNGSVGIGHCTSVSSGRIAESDYSYDQSNVSSVSLPATWHDNSNYSASAPRANLTTITRRCITTGCSGDPVTTATYDAAGQIQSITDPCGNSSCSDMVSGSHTIHFYYQDNFASGYGSPTASTDAFITQSTNALGQSSNYSWAFSTGELATSKDPNNNLTTYCYFTGGCAGSTVDPWDRLTEIDYPDSGKVTTSFYDQGASPYSTTKRSINAGMTESTTTTRDELGRVVKTSNDSDPDGSDYVDTVYDGVGRVMKKSNPYRTGPSPQAVYYYDSLGRPTIQANPDNSSLQWCYDSVPADSQTNCHSQLGSIAGEWVDFADENGNDWQRTTDGLGRLVTVFEPSGASQAPSMETDYTYDLLDNLRTVTQWGGASGAPSPRIRSFTYDGLSRLLTASNSESGTVCYGEWNNSACMNGYDANGNLQYKTDARNIAVSYNYDVVNRLLSKTYSDGQTPISCYQFDISSFSCGSGTGNLIGRLTNTWTQKTGTTCPSSSPASGQYLSLKSMLCYDAMGRPSSTQQQQCIGTACSASSPYAISMSYDLAGNQISSTNSVGANGSPLTLTNYFDTAARPCLTTSSWTTGFSPNLFQTNPATSTTPPAYWPFGELGNWYLGSNTSSASTDCSTTPSSSINLQQQFDTRLRLTNFSSTGQVP